MTTANILNYRGYTAAPRMRDASGPRPRAAGAGGPAGGRRALVTRLARRSTLHTSPRARPRRVAHPAAPPPPAALRNQSPDAASASAVSAAATVSRGLSRGPAPADSTRRYLTSPRLSVSVRSYGLDAMADLRGPRTPLSGTARQCVIRPVPHHARVEIHLP